MPLVWLPATVCTRSKRKDENDVGYIYTIQLVLTPMTSLEQFIGKHQGRRILFLMTQAVVDPLECFVFYFQ